VIVSGSMPCLTSSLVAARQKVVELENAYNQVQAVLKGRVRAKLDSVPAVLRNATVVRVKELENEASRRVTESSTESFPLNLSRSIVRRHSTSTNPLATPLTTWRHSRSCPGCPRTTRSTTDESR